MATWNSLNRGITDCSRCGRLLEHCRRMGEQKRRAFAEWKYWARPVPNFGDPQARLLIVGLAPAAHGANRTGRMFTGDRSGDWLYRALHKAGFASQPHATDVRDGLRLANCAITSVCHCAPPGNKPSRDEITNCQEWLQTTFDLVPAQVYLALGQMAWRAIVDEARRRAWHEAARPKFGHAAVVKLAGERWLVGSYHPSQQNTFTGRLTEPMFDEIFRTVAKLLRRRKEAART